MAIWTGDTAKGNFSNTRIAPRRLPPDLGLPAFGDGLSAVPDGLDAGWMAVLASAIDPPGYASDRRACRSPAIGFRRSGDWTTRDGCRAEILQIEAGLKSRTQAIAERGYDAEQVDAKSPLNASARRTGPTSGGRDPRHRRPAAARAPGDAEANSRISRRTAIKMTTARPGNPGPRRTHDAPHPDRPARLQHALMVDPAKALAFLTGLGP